MAEPLVAQAIAALKNKDFAAARDCMAIYGRAQPLEFQHYQIRGLAELSLGAWGAAQATFTAATARYPDEAQLWFNLGLAQENLRDLKNAAGSYRCSLRLKPAQAEACGNLSNVCCRLARFEEAEAMARRALELGAPRAQALNSLGLALNRQNEFAQAQATYEDALKLEPDNVPVLFNLANLAVDQLDFPRAWTFFARARAAGSDAPLIRQHEGMARLLAGDYEIGWKLYEARLEMPGALRVQPPCPRWKGEALDGSRLMIVAEQGFGDAIQFCRYGKFFMEAGADLLWIMPENLHRLLAANLPGRTFSEKRPLPEADFYLPMLSLPLALGLPMPEQAPETIVQALLIEDPLLPQSPKKKIGLVWTGSPTHERDFERSIPLASFAPLWEKIPAQFYAPFIGTEIEQIGDAPITRLDHLIEDFADTASLFEQLDYLVTVDTAAAHLAGAIGVETFLLLPYCPDWRWGIGGEETPWYPGLTLLRQPRPGDWDSVVRRLIESLSSKV